MVIWTDPAKIALHRVHGFIAKDSKFYADKVLNKIINQSEKLNLFPQMGRIVPEVDDPNIRELIIFSYRLIYELSNSNILILTIVNAKQEFPSNIVN